MRPRLLFALAALCGLVATACSDSGPDWDHEVILQLFKPRDLAAGVVIVTATQPPENERMRVDEDAHFSFADCESNRVRIIPHQDVDRFRTVSIEVTAAKLAGGPILARAERVVALPAPAPVKMVLGASAPLEPQGACTPPAPTPDAGAPDGPPADAGETPDAGGDGGGAKPTGAPCASPTECLGGVCATELTTNGQSKALPGGYCTHDCDCSASSCVCEPGEQCKENTNGLGQVTSRVCLLTCSGTAPCASTNHECTPGGVCLPKDGS